MHLFQKGRRLSVLVTAQVLSIVFSCPNLQAAPTSSLHPSENQPELPNFESESDTRPFVLPPLDEDKQPEVSVTGTKVMLQRIEWQGNTVFSAEKMDAVAKPYLNKPIDVAELEALRFDITQYYIKHGYINSGALIPEQTIAEGVLRIDIVEGRLNQINIDGAGWLHPDYLRSRLEMTGPFSVEALQKRFLLLLNDPLVENLNGKFRPLPTLGESALDLHVTRARPYQVALHYNNYSPPSIGAEQVHVDAWVRNLTRWGDKLDFSYSSNEGADTFAGGFGMPISSQGTWFDFHFEVGRASIIEEPLAAIDIKSEVRNFSWTLSHPFLQDPQQTLNLGISFASRRSETTLLGQQFSFVKGIENGRTKASVLRFFQEYMARLQDHVFAFRSTFNVGIDVFDATVQSGSLPDSEFFAWLGQIQYAYRLNDEGAQLRLTSTAQFSDQELLPQERIVVGGRYSVRGYRENELVRDNGYHGSIELHYPVFSQQGRFAQTLFVVPFMDYGLGYNDGGKTEELHAVGVGLMWQLLGHVRAELYYAHDLISAANKSEHNLQDDGIHFNVSLFAF